MAEAKHGDNVKIHYTGKLDDGTVFDSSTKREPLQFKIGENKIIPTIEQNVIGMKQGESKVIKIPAEKAYGPHRKELVIELDRKKIPADVKLKVGQTLQLRQATGQTILATVAALSDATVTLDANHPLAGKDLTFDVQLVEIV